MQDINKILSSLSPEKRALLEKKLKNRSQNFNSFPLSFAQERLWFLDKLDPGSNSFNIPAAVKFSGNLNVAVLEQSINEILKRHEILRTKIVDINEIPMQVISNDIAFKINLIDYSSTNEKNNVLQKKIKKNNGRYFDLTKYPLFNIDLFKIDNNEHVLHIVMHHIITDGWSVGIFINELSTCYSAILKNLKLELPELSIQYADYSKWQKKWKNSDEFSKLLNYWKKQLGNGSPKLNLPYDNSSNNSNNLNANICEIVFPTELVKEIRQLAMKSNVTLFMFFAAVLKIFLFKYTLQTDISIGTPVANRNKKQIQNLLGFFVNLIVLRTHVDRRQSFTDLLKVVRQTALEGFENQEMPFELLVDEIQPERDLNTTPLFTVMYSYSSLAKERLKLPEIELSKVDIDFKVSQYELTFNIYEDDKDQIVMGLEYNENLFSSKRIYRLVENFKILLNSLIKNPELLIADHNIISNVDLETINYNSLTNEMSNYDNAINQFETIVEKYNSKTALKYKDTELAYSELNSKVNRLAYYIHNSLKIRNKQIGVYLDNSIEHIVTILSILKSGNSFLPIDINYPTLRINQISTQANLSLLISTEENSKNLELENCRIINLDLIEMSLKNYPKTNLKLKHNPNEVAYCIFTSGSTGIPKGVLIGHENLTTFINGAKEFYRINDNDKILQFSSTSFDASIEEIFLALTSGCTLVIKNDEMLTEANEFINIIDSEKISILDLPTAYWTQLAEQMLLNKSSIPNSLNHIIVGGDNIDAYTLKRFLNYYGSKINFSNGYGPTETTVVATAWKYLKNSNPNIQNKIPIGKVLKGYSAFVLDDRFNRLPVGSTGELFIGGNGVGQGYINNPKITAASFIPDPFSRIEGKRLYRSGDLVQILENGELVFVGRKDNQVKVRGFRIELSEIINAVKSIPGVIDATVILNKTNSDTQIYSYIISNNDLTSDIDDIRKSIKEKIPSFMIPSRFYQVSEIPLNINGKIDKNKLLSVRTELKSEKKITRQLTETEVKLLGIIKSLLDIDNVNINDNFFNIGGHSLIATQLTGKIRNEFGIDYKVRGIFEAVEIIDIAEGIDEMKFNTSEIIKIPIQENRNSFPLSFAQQRLWFLDQIEPSSSFYNIPFAIKIKGEFNFQTFNDSINEVIKRHEILRTSFISVDGKPSQKVIDKLNYQTELVDLRKTNSNLIESKVKEICINESMKGFQLVEGPLFRIVVVLLNELEFTIMTNIHHIISDGWSSNIFVREINKIYQAKLYGFSPKLEPMSIQYGDYSHWQRENLKDDNLKSKIDFWKKYLKSAPSVLKLPLDNERPEIQTYNGAIEELKISGDTNSLVSEIINEEKATYFMFFLTTYYVLLYRLTNQDDIVVGTPVANRESEEIQNLIGLFVNTIVIRGDLSDNPNFIELLNRVKESSINSFDNKELPFEKILDAVSTDRNVSYSPLFQVMFTYNHYEKSKEINDDFEYEEIKFKSVTSKFDLSLTVQETSDKDYIYAFEYNTDLFSKETIKSWLKYYKYLIEEVLSNKSRKILNLRVANANILENNLATTQNKSIIQNLEFHSKIKPKDVAITFERKSLNYQELDNYSSFIANQIIKSGDKTGGFIGIYLDRSIESIVSIIAILKAGMAFVPLDIKLSDERLDYIVTDLKINTIISNNTYRIKIPKTVHVIELNNLEIIKSNIVKEKLFNINSSFELPAYAIYTSGTSGNPKGVVVSINSLNNFIDSACKDYSITAKDTLLQFASLSFDTCLEEIFPILNVGGKLVLRSDEMISSTEKMLESIKEYGITILDLPTAFWHQLTSDMIANNYNYSNELHTIIIGGEKASKAVFKSWEKSFGKNVRLLNTYGPTEATVVAAYWSSKDKLNYFNELPIGRNLSNSELHVLDLDYNDVPIGIVGELFIGGNSLAMGYNNDSLKTANQFIPNPFSKKSGARLYKTGDLVRKINNNSIEYIGRSDNQIKIRGFRVEISEIENAINNLKEIKESIVVAKSRNNRTVLVCYYVSISSKDIEYADFTDLLKSTIPEYMIPNNFVLLNKIPLTNNGKVDRKKIANIKIEKTNNKKKIVLPTSDNEKILFEVWRDVLGVKEIGITDNFFELGGDSIIGIQVISSAKRKGLSLSPVQLFQHQTIQKLALVAKEAKIIKAEQGVISGSVSCLPIQKIFFEKKFKNENHWNQSLLFKVNKKLISELVEKAVYQLALHHDVLRIRKEASNSGELIINENYNTKSFEYVDLVTTSNDVTEIIERKNNEYQASLNIVDGLVFKIVYYNINNSEGRLLFVFHHLVIDGVSWRILLEDFQNLYSTFENNISYELPQKTTSFKEWSLNCANILKDKLKDSELNYWLTTASKYSNYTAPFRIESENKESLSESISYSFDEKLTQQLLKEVNKKFNTKINDILLTSILLAYSKWSGKRTLFINMEGHGRNDISEEYDLSRTIGWFTVIYPLCLELNKAITVEDTIINVKYQLKKITNDGMGYGIIRYLNSQKEVKDKLFPLDKIGITFNYLGQFDNIKNGNTIFENANESKGLERDPNNQRDSELDITCSVFNNKLNVEFNFGTNNYEKSKIEKLKNAFVEKLTEVVDVCMGKRISSKSSSDFELANLNNKKFNKVLAQLKKK